MNPRFQINNSYSSKTAVDQFRAFQVRSYLRPTIGSNQQHSQNYGTFNEFKLDDLINLQSDGFNDPKVIRLAFV